MGGLIDDERLWFAAWRVRARPSGRHRDGSVGPKTAMLTGLGIDEYLQRTDASGASSYLTDRPRPHAGAGELSRRPRSQLHV